MAQLVIQMLGEFSIRHEDNVINDQSKRSKKMWMLLKYLITFRDREILQSEIFDLLWPEGQSENPTGALKTQLHRLRAVLDELGLPDGQEIIVSSMGSYAFNNSLDYVVDANEFERFFKLSMNPELSEKEQTGFLIKAFDLYRGDFLHKSAEEKWVVPINVYYHSVYMRIVHRLIDIFYRHKRYTDLIDVCRRSLLVENNDQNVHYMLIKALIESGERTAAKKQYNYAIDWFYNKQRINPIPEIVALYEEMAKTDKSFETNLEVVKEQLSEKSDTDRKGAFFCEYEFFKHVYHLELRDAVRNQHTVFLCLLTVADRTGLIPDTKILTKAMKQLQEGIAESLRLSDIFARYSVSQYVIMLPNATEESCEMVLKRVIRRFKQDNPRTPVVINFKFGEVTQSEVIT